MEGLISSRDRRFREEKILKRVVFQTEVPNLPLVVCTLGITKRLRSHLDKLDEVRALGATVETPSALRVSRST